MKNLFCLSLLLTLLFSCGKDTEEKKDQGFSFGEPLTENSPLTADEVKIGIEACTLLRDKREYFETFEDNKVEFDFKGREQVCGKNPAQLGNYTARLRVPTRGPLVFGGNFSKLIDEVITDKQGFFSHYCDVLDPNIENYRILGVGGKKVNIKISKTNGLIKLESAWYYPNDDGVFKAYLMDGAILHSKNSTRNRRYFGTAYKRVKARACDNGTARFVEQELKGK